MCFVRISSFGSSCLEESPFAYYDQGLFSLRSVPALYNNPGQAFTHTGSHPFQSPASAVVKQQFVH